MTIEEVLSYWEEFDAEIDDLYEVYRDDVLLRQREVVEFTIAALRAQEAEKKNTLETTWETPESCPCCMEHLSRDWSFCPECGQPTDWSPNDPLTLDELREMDGDKVYIKFIGACKGFYDDEYAPYFGKYEQYVQKYNGMLRVCDLPLKYYGESWLAYRRKTKEGTQ